MSKSYPKNFRRYIPKGHAMRPLLSVASIGILNLFGVPKLDIALSKSTELLSQNPESYSQTVSR